MAKNIGRLAGLAALAGAAYMASKGKDKEGPSATAAEKEASDARTKAQKDAVSGNRVTNESSYTGTTKNDSNVTKNIGFGGGDDSDKNLKRVDSAVKPKPASKPAAKPVSKPSVMTKAQNDALAIAGKKSKTAAENTALAKVNRGMGREVTEAAKANAAPAPTTSSKVKDTTPVTTTPAAKPAPANKFEHEMPIARFFKNVREAGNRGNPDAKMASGGMAASRRGDGIAQRGKTRGKMC